MPSLSPSLYSNHKPLFERQAFQARSREFPHNFTAGTTAEQYHITRGQLTAPQAESGLTFGSVLFWGTVSIVILGSALYLPTAFTQGWDTSPGGSFGFLDAVATLVTIVVAAVFGSPSRNEGTVTGEDEKEIWSWIKRTKPAPKDAANLVRDFMALREQGNPIDFVHYLDLQGIVSAAPSGTSTAENEDPALGRTSARPRVDPKRSRAVLTPGLAERIASRLIRAGVPDENIRWVLAYASQLSQGRSMKDALASLSLSEEQQRWLTQLMTLPGPETGMAGDLIHLLLHPRSDQSERLSQPAHLGVLMSDVELAQALHRELDTVKRWVANGRLKPAYVVPGRRGTRYFLSRNLTGYLQEFASEQTGSPQHPHSQVPPEEGRERRRPKSSVARSPAAIVLGAVALSLASYPELMQSSGWDVVPGFWWACSLLAIIGAAIYKRPDSPTLLFEDVATLRIIRSLTLPSPLPDIHSKDHHSSNPVIYTEHELDLSDPATRKALRIHFRGPLDDPDTHATLISYQGWTDARHLALAIALSTQDRILVSMLTEEDQWLKVWLERKGLGFDLGLYPFLSFQQLSGLLMGDVQLDQASASLRLFYWFGHRRRSRPELMNFLGTATMYWYVSRGVEKVWDLTRQAIRRNQQSPASNLLLFLSAA